MKIAFVVLLVIHGSIHLIGFAKARNPEGVEAIMKPVGRIAGWLWLAAAVLWVVAAATLAVAPKFFALAAAPSWILSQSLILSSWKDARFGTIVNLLVVVPAVTSVQDLRGASFQVHYCRDAEAIVRGRAKPRVVGTNELVGLPVPLRNYLVRVGVVGRPRVSNFRAHFTAEFRRNPNAAWMDAEAEQVESFPEVSRLFLIRSSVWGVPFDGYHRFVGDSATMQVRVLSLFDVVNASGKTMTAGETVTLLNDMCLLAPASLLDANIRWRQTDETSVHATWTHQGNTVTAELVFDASGDLVNFVSNDRYLSEDGKTYTKYPWATPIRGYRDAGGRRVPAHADVVWRLPSGNFTYGRFDVQSIEYNVAAAGEHCSSNG